MLGKLSSALLGFVLAKNNLSSFYKGMEKYMVSFVRALNNLGDFHTMGYIKIDLNADSFKMCVPVQSMYGEQIFLFNANKEIIYPYPVSSEQEIYDRYYSMRNGNYLMSRSKTKNLDVEVIGFLSVDKYHNNTYDLLWGLLITYFITLLFTILLISLITNQIVRPIQDIKLAIEKIIQHDFSVRVKINTNDELGELGEGFNWMAKEINQLLLDEKAAFLREQQAQFSLLFGQISPHFMYNTLESMSSMALVDGNYELSDGIVALSRLLRHTINKNETLVYLRDEVSFVQNYIKLQTLSMGERINFNFEVDIAHEYLFIPKFILQPLVENIYEHASTSYRLDAWIRSGISGNKLILSIIDNGMGIPPKRLEYIRNRLYSNATEITPPTEKKRRGYALKNIHDRIRILYGKPYGIYIPEQPEKGTEIQIILPVIWEV